MTEEQPQAGLSLEKIYLKDVSFEAPNTPEIFLKEISPQLDINIEITHRKIDGEDDLYEVVLPVTVSAQDDKQTSFLVELHQAGVFSIKGFQDEEMPMVLEIACPNILLPYARQMVSTLLGAGGFPPVLINPVNFDALYAQRHPEVAAGHA